MANTTPQTQPLAGQVANSAGGYVYELDDAQRLARFLVLGSEAGTYYTKPAQNQLENVAALERMVAAGRGVEAVEAIRALSLAGRAPKQTPTLHCLALCARSADAETKAAAYAALSDVCRIPTHLFEFLECAENASGEATGWGRAHRRAVAGWYNGKGALGLAQAVTKYQQRNGWAHLDALRLCHAKPADAAHAAVFTYVVKGLAAAEEKAAQAEDQGEAEAVLAYLRAVEQMKRCTDAGECAALIVDHRLAREHVSSSLLSSGPVWAALLQGMPLTALTRNLAKMTAVGLIAPGSEAAALVCRRLGDAAALRKARVHPFSVLLAHKTYAAGQGDKGSLTWQPAAEVVAALDKAFQLAFAAVVPAGKRFLLALDVSGSMGSAMGAGNMYGGGGGSSMSCHEAAAAMALVTLETEPCCEVMGFASEFRALPLRKGMTLQACQHATQGMSFGATDCAKPMTWAMAQKKAFDVFVVYTDCETYHGSVHPSEALRQYRRASGIADARLVVVGMSSNGFSIADPADPFMMDVVGFDAASPAVMADFAAGLI